MLLVAVLLLAVVVAPTVDVGIVYVDVAHFTVLVALIVPITTPFPEIVFAGTVAVAQTEIVLVEALLIAQAVAPPHSAITASAPAPMPMDPTMPGRPFRCVRRRERCLKMLIATSFLTAPSRGRVLPVLDVVFVALDDRTREELVPFSTRVASREAVLTRLLMGLSALIREALIRRG